MAAQVSDKTPRFAVDLRDDGLLWAINRTLLHPRGFALSVEMETGTLWLLGDGSEPWQYAEAMEAEEARCFAAFEKLLADAQWKAGE